MSLTKLNLRTMAHQVKIDGWGNGTTITVGDFGKDSSFVVYEHIVKNEPPCEFFSLVCPNPCMVTIQPMGEVWDQIYTQPLIGSLHRRGMQKCFMLNDEMLYNISILQGVNM